MASVVNICNMALSQIGSDARVSSISPPDGSVEAGVCADFYNLARTEMLEAGNWQFSLRRAALASVANASDVWAFAYAAPSAALMVKRIIQAGAGDDAESADFMQEGDVIYTNEEDAKAVYTVDIVDTTKFSPSFVSALSFLLSSYIAGPLIKGSEGMKISDAMRQRALFLSGQSNALAANSSSESADFTPSSKEAR